MVKILLHDHVTRGGELPEGFQPPSFANTMVSSVEWVNVYIKWKKNNFQQEHLQGFGTPVWIMVYRIKNLS